MVKHQPPGNQHLSSSSYFHSQPTQPIRIPQQLKQQVRHMAHLLDQENIITFVVQLKGNLTRVTYTLEGVSEELVNEATTNEVAIAQDIAPHLQNSAIPVTSVQANALTTGEPERPIFPTPPVILASEQPFQPSWSAKSGTPTHSHDSQIAVEEQLSRVIAVQLIEAMKGSDAETVKPSVQATLGRSPSPRILGADSSNQVEPELEQKRQDAIDIFNQIESGIVELRNANLALAEQFSSISRVQVLEISLDTLLKTFALNLFKVWRILALSPDPGTPPWGTVVPIQEIYQRFPQRHLGVTFLEYLGQTEQIQKHCGYPIRLHQATGEGVAIGSNIYSGISFHLSETVQQSFLPLPLPLVQVEDVSPEPKGTSTSLTSSKLLQSTTASLPMSRPKKHCLPSATVVAPLKHQQIRKWLKKWLDIG